MKWIKCGYVLSLNQTIWIQTLCFLSHESQIKSDCSLNWWGKVLRKQGLNIWWTQLHKAVKNLVGGATLYITKMKSHGHNSIVDDKGLYLVEEVGKASKIRLLIHKYVKFG